MEIVRRRNPDQKGARTTIPIKTETENLILRRRGFLSEAVAKRLTDRGGSGVLWEAKLNTQRIGWLESDGQRYWGLLSEEDIPTKWVDRSTRY